MPTEEVLPKSIWKVAAVLYASPFFVAIPFSYWVYHFAGSWFVAKGMEPSIQSAYLTVAFLMDMAAFTAVAWFLGTLLLFLAGYGRPWMAILLLPLLLLVFPATAIFVITVDSYFRYS